MRKKEILHEIEEKSVFMMIFSKKCVSSQRNNQKLKRYEEDSVYYRVAESEVV